MANNPQNPNYKPGVGRLVTDRYDFAGHYNGTEFRHNATQIDILNPALVPGGATTVELALDAIQGFIEGQADVGGGFITVGDGYDTYHAANGNVNFDNTVPPLDTLLNPIFAAIVAYQNNNTPVPLAYERIKDGGIVVIKAGTYIVRNTISIPPGITLMGEGYGTKIVNFTSITVPNNYPNSPPFVNPVGTPLPVFKILADSTRLDDGPVISTDKFMFADVTKIRDMVICDNFVEPTILGEVFYLAPQNRTTLSPSRQSDFDEALILQEMGSSFTMDNVFMIGRASASSATIGGNTYQVTQGCTGFVHAIDQSALVTSGTVFKIKNCVIDGFQMVTSFMTAGGSEDYLEVDGCQIRDYGIGVDAVVFSTTDNNIKITNNTIYCEGFSYWGLTPVAPMEQMLLWAVVGSTYTGPNAPAPALQQRSKILVAGNNINLDKSSNVPNSKFNLISDVFCIHSIPTYVTTLAYGNSMNGTAGDVFDVEVDNVTIISGSSTNTTINNAFLTGATTFASGFYSSVNPLFGAISSTAYLSAPKSITVPANIISNGDLIHILGSNLGTNGLWIVAQTSPTTYQLVGSSSHTPVLIPSQGSFTVINHNVSSSDYMLVPPTATVTLPYPSTTELSQNISSTGSGPSTVSTAASSAVGPGYVGQYLTITEATESANNGIFQITSYTPIISGSGASIDIHVSGLIHTAHLTVPSGTPFNAGMIGQLITISGSANSNGTWTIEGYISPTEITWAQGGGGNDPNNPNISWSISANFGYTNNASQADIANSTIDGAFIITLPSIVNGRTLVVKDPGGASPTEPVVVAAQTGQTFDNSGLGTYIVTSPTTSLSFIGYGSVWYLV